MECEAWRVEAGASPPGEGKGCETVSIVTIQILRISKQAENKVTNMNIKPELNVETGGNLTNHHEMAKFFVKKCKSFCNFL